MNPWLKLVVALAAAAGFSLFAAVAWFVWLLLTSPSEDGFGQDHQEQWAVASCWRDVRDGSIRDTEQCSEYAQAHLEFFTDQLAANAATTTCNLSRSHLEQRQEQAELRHRLNVFAEGTWFLLANLIAVGGLVLGSKTSER